LKIYPELTKKMVCIPNGVDNFYIDNEMNLKTWEEKENIIITVGRIGSHQKNTELLLESIKDIELNSWKVYILGPIEESFRTYIDTFFKHNPYLIDQIIFTGNISDRKELFEWYNRAKIFCLTSRSEGFPITFPEALYFGNYIISTPVSSATYITNNGQFGMIVKAESQDLATTIKECISDGFLTKKRFEDTLQFSRTNFTWLGIVKKLSDKLKEDA